VCLTPLSVLSTRVSHTTVSSLNQFVSHHSKFSQPECLTPLSVLSTSLSHTTVSSLNQFVSHHSKFSQLLLAPSSRGRRAAARQWAA
jgi:hypothetical protein